MFLSRLMEEEKLKKDSSSVTQLLKRLKSAAELKGWSLEQRTARMKEREKKVVAKCFHGAGIVVPIDQNGVGYRPLPETPGVLVHCVQKKTPTYVFDYNSGVSWSIFILFVPVEIGMNTLQYTYLQS